MTEMTLLQKELQARRLLLEEQLFKTQQELSDISMECKDHFIIRGRTIYSPRRGKVVNTHEGLPSDWHDGCYSVSCAICGKDMGWHCPVNPKGYCEYKENDRGGDCIHCHISGERK